MSQKIFVSFYLSKQGERQTDRQTDWRSAIFHRERRSAPWTCYKSNWM